MSHDPQRFKRDWLGPRTKIDGLRLKGQDVMSVGIAGVRPIGPMLTKLMIRRRTT